MLESADSFFENFDQQVVIKSGRDSPQTKERPKYYAEANIHYDQKKTHICKSLEKIFQMCNNETVKKHIIPNSTQGVTSTGNQSQRLKTHDELGNQKYIHSNKNHSINQLKCLFQKKFEKTQPVSTQQLNGSISQRPQDDKDRQQKLRNQSFHQIPGAEAYVQRQLQKHSQSYLILKQHLMKNKSLNKSKSFLNNETLLNQTSSNEQTLTRKASESVNYRPKNQSLHTNVTITQPTNLNTKNPYSMVQLLKPRNDQRPSSSQIRQASPSGMSPFVTARGNNKKPYQSNQSFYDLHSYMINKPRKTDSFVNENSRSGENFAVYLNFADFKKLKQKN